jgi:uncharacterized membrane protein HdeD (DUF308 family)
MNQSLLSEALVIGVMALIVGVIVHSVSMKLKKHDMNNMKVYAIHLFIIGILVHLIFQYAGINKWYCTNGLACKV